MKENNVVTSETKDALSFGSLSHTAASSSHPCDRVSCRWSNIEEKQALKICQVSENLSSLVQHLAWLTWCKVSPEVTDQMIEQAIDELLDQNHLFYQRDMETMTVYQKNFLIAVANGINSGLSRREVLNEYHLESSANVQGVKKALIARDFILPSNQLILYLNHPILQQGLLPCACQL